MVSVLSITTRLLDVLRLVDKHVAEIIWLKCRSEEGASRAKDAARYVMDLYVPQEEGGEPKPLIDQLDEAEGRIKGLLLDTPTLRRPRRYLQLSTTTRASTCRRSQKMWTWLVLWGAMTSCLPRRRSSRSSTLTLTEVALKRTLDVGQAMMRQL
jgi:hypothetical protein